MSVDRLQEKIRKGKNVLMVDMTLCAADLPPAVLNQDCSGARKLQSYVKELLSGLKGIVPAVRFRMSPFALMGPEGLEVLRELLKSAAALGYYIALDVPLLTSSEDAALAVRAPWEADGMYPCDGAIVYAYPGSDVLKPFLPFCTEAKKDLFVLVRTSNRSASEMQDLLTGSRLVHTVAVDLTNRFSGEAVGKFGYSRVGAVAAATSAESLRSLRSKYPAVFFLLDGFDSPSANAKNCSFAFDKYGRGAVVCAGESITCAWKQGQSDGSDFVDCAVKAAERMKKNLTRYVTVL